MKNKIFITTDSEIDDRCSLNRMLFYTDVLDIRGIVSVNSGWQKDGHGVIWMHELIEKYAMDYENAIVHNKEFTKPANLHAVVREGYVGRYGLYMDEPDLHPTPGSDLLIKELINDDLQPLHICMWGSGIMISYVFNEIKKNYNSYIYDRACKKAKLFYIAMQEYGKAGANYMRINHPNVQNIISYQFQETFNYRPRKHQPFEELMGEEFVGKYIANQGSHLGKAYPGLPFEFCDDPSTTEYGLYITEGDSMSFFHAINLGLKGYLDPTLGSLAGRFVKVGENFYDDAVDDGPMHYSLARNTRDLQYDFANRVSWFSTDKYDECVHYPSMKIIEERSGNKVKFILESNQDVNFNVYVYKEISTQNYELEKIKENEYLLEIYDDKDVHVRFECYTKDDIYLKVFDHKVINISS